MLNTFAFCKYSEAPIEIDVLQAVKDIGSPVSYSFFVSTTTAGGVSP